MRPFSRSSFVAVSFVVTAAAAFLGACSSSERQSGTVVPQEQMLPGNQTGSQAAGPSVHYRTSLEGDAVVIEIRDRNNAYRVDRVELIAPDGRSYPASDITREKVTDNTTYGLGGSNVGIGVGGWGGSSSGVGVGVGLGFPLGGGRYSDPDAEARTTARIRLPDPAAYRANPNGWLVRTTFSDLTGQTSSAVMPAPKPAG